MLISKIAIRICFNNMGSYLWHSCEKPWENTTQILEVLLVTRFGLHSLQCRRKIDSVLWLVNVLRSNIDSSEILSRLKIRTSVARLRSNKIFELAIPRTNILLAVGFAFTSSNPKLLQIWRTNWFIFIQFAVDQVSYTIGGK